MTLVVLVAIIALGAVGVIVVMLAIAHVEHIDDASGAMPTPSDAPSSKETPEAAARAPKPARRFAWRGITQAWTSRRHRHANDVLYRPARRRRRALAKEQVGWLAAGAVFLFLVSYLIAQI